MTCLRFVDKCILVILCVLCMGAAPKKPGAYTVTIKVDTTYVKTGATEDGVALYRQKVDTVETWVDASILDSINVNIQQWKWDAVNVPLYHNPIGIIDTSGTLAW